MDRLQLRYDTTDQGLTLRPFIDGHDLLSEYKNDQGLDPDQLLPPLSTRLLPTRDGHVTIIGVCSCGETGCGSLSITIRRIGTEVYWEPVEAKRHETVNRAYRFDLTDYLDAVDDAAGGPPVGEGQGRRVARSVRLALGLYDQQYESLTMFYKAKIDWIGAWPWTSDVVKASVTTVEGQEVHEFSARLDESEANFARRVAAEIHGLLLPTRSS